METVSVTKSEAQIRIEALLPVLEGDRAFKSIKYPVRSNWASKMGHPCERFLYYLRHDWEKLQERDWKGLGIRGNLIADWWKRYMMEKGYIVIHDQLPLSDEIVKKYQIGGRIDGRIGWGNIKPMLYEFKTMSDRYYDAINTYEDFAESKAEWIRGYPAQLQLYLLSENEEAGLFILCKPETLEWKVIPVYLDYAYTEWLIGRADRVNRANAGQLPVPERIPYGKTCQGCSASLICLPDIMNEGLDMMDNEHLIQLRRTCDEMKPSVERYIQADDESKDIAKKIGKDFIVGTDYKVEVKRTSMTRIDTKKIPIEERAKYEVDSETVRVNFVPLNPSV